MTSNQSMQPTSVNDRTRSQPLAVAPRILRLQPQHHPMKTTITTFALVLGAICGFAVESVIAGDQENIQGTWTLETASVDGKAMPGVSVVYIFTGETLIVRPKVGAEQKATFKLETTSKPKVLVVQRDQPADAKPDRTPYELDGDTLKIALTSPDERATEVSDKGHVLFTLKRNKP
jgi:uncharacterized protein (TIGR03067 family)